VFSNSFCFAICCPRCRLGRYQKPYRHQIRGSFTRSEPIKTDSPSTRLLQCKSLLLTWSPSVCTAPHIYQVSQRTWITSPYYRVTTSIHRRFTSIGRLTLFASHGARCNEARRARWIGFDCVRQVRVEARSSPRE